MTNRGKSGRFEPTDKKVEVSKAPSLPSGTGINSRAIGNTGLKRTGGYIYEEFLAELSGPNGRRVYQEMRENDPIVGAMFFAIEMFLRKVDWFIDPATEDDKGEADAKFLRECKDDMSHTWSDFIAEVMTMMTYGWSWFEVLYKLRTEEFDEYGNAKSKYPDGRIGWRKFDPRSQDSLEEWVFDADGGLVGMQQSAAPNYDRVTIPIKKSLLFRTTTQKNSPEGRSVLRNAYRPWYFKKRIEEIEGVGVERDLAGLPFAEVPAEMLRDNANDADKATLASIIELVKNVRRDEQEGVVWPQSWDENGNKMYEFSLMSSGGTRAFSTDAIITRYESRIAMVILADFILLGNDAAGSFAMSLTKSGMFQAALGAWLDVIQDVLNNYAVPRLFRLNNIEGPFPTFRHDDVQAPSLTDLATFIAALAGAGAQLFPDVELENHFRSAARLPQREAEDSQKKDEDKLRDAKLEAQMAQAKETIKNPAGPKPTPPSRQPVQGAPTKTTGPVKSKLPPQQRRNTSKDVATNNVKKRRVVRRSKK